MRWGLFVLVLVACDDGYIPPEQRPPPPQQSTLCQKVGAMFCGLEMACRPSITLDGCVARWTWAHCSSFAMGEDEANACAATWAGDCYAVVIENGWTETNGPLCKP